MEGQNCWSSGEVDTQCVTQGETMSTPDVDHELDKELRQYMLEQESVHMGQERYNRLLEKHRYHGQEDLTKPARLVVQRTITMLADAIDEDRNRTRKAGRYRTGVKAIEDVASEALAYMTLRIALGTVSDRTTWSSAARRLGFAVQEELRMKAYAEQAPKDYMMTQTSLKRMQMRHQGYDFRHIMRQSQNSGVEFSEFDSQTKLHVGSYLLDQLCTATGLWHAQTVRESKARLSRLLVPDPSLSTWIEEAHEAMGMLLPVRLPMVVPPKPWSDPWNGGYLTDLGGPISLVKTRNKEYLKTLESVEMPLIYEAVNALQDVRWQINSAVLSAAQWMWHEGMAVGPFGAESLPARTDLAPPPFPQEWAGKVAEFKRVDPKGYKTWAKKAAEVHQENERQLSKRVSCQTMLKLAEKLEDDEAIYYPHALDFRGRIYPIPAGLQPQGNDLAKGLLRFADGKPLGEQGVYWLKVHIANCFGVDKVSFQDRIAWVDARSELLADSGIEPIDGERFWMKADDPFQALAACIEYAGYLIEGESYVSHIPVGMDGSNNGLQHFSAMVRDPVGGAATNLLPHDKPADIYQQVADLVIQRVKTDAEANVAEAVRFDGYVNRSLIKQPVMTLPYGATLNGMRKQLEVAVRKLGNPMQIKGSDMWTTCGYLAKVVREAISQVVVSAVAAMDWLQEVAAIASREEAPVSWTSPAGLPVLQEYRQYISRQLRVHIQGKQVKLRMAQDTDKLDTRKQKLAISPNVVHSIDASHLMFTVSWLVAQGIKHIAMVHDSYAVHAADVPTLHTCLRRAFIDMHSGNVLEVFRSEVAAQLHPEAAEMLPPVPDHGSLDLEQVMDSWYFFA